MNEKLAELEKDVLTDLHEQRLKNIEETERLPKGIDRDKFLARVASFSKYKTYIVLDEATTNDLASKHTFVINKGRVTAQKVISYDLDWNATKKDRTAYDKKVHAALAIMQRDMQVEFAQQLDDYLDDNPSVKVAESFFVNFTHLRWSTATLMDDKTFDRVLGCNFLLRFNMYIK